MKKIFAILAVFGILTFAFITPHVEARWRIWSHRVGGTNSHGKGSHYVGGY